MMKESKKIEKPGKVYNNRSTTLNVTRSAFQAMASITNHSRLTIKKIRKKNVLHNCFYSVFDKMQDATFTSQ